MGQDHSSSNQDKLYKALYKFAKHPDVKTVQELYNRTGECCKDRRIPECVENREQLETDLKKLPDFHDTDRSLDRSELIILTAETVKFLIDQKIVDPISMDLVDIDGLVDEMIEEADQDGDGKLNLVEFRAISVRYLSMVISKVNGRNKDMSHKERSHVKHLGSIFTDMERNKVTLEELEQLFDRFDTNGDGILDRSECERLAGKFILHCANKNGTTNAAREGLSFTKKWFTDIMFELGDDNHDGFLDRAEFIELMSDVKHVAIAFSKRLKEECTSESSSE